MSREILFRGRRVDGGGWVEGSLLQFDNGDCAICNPSWSDAMLKVQVDPATVGQFTGVCDILGNRVYEGDVVKIDEGNSFYNDYIVWEKYMGSFYLKLEHEEFSSAMNYKTFSGEVVGNIHDNPELAEVTA